MWSVYGVYGHRGEGSGYTGGRVSAFPPLTHVFTSLFSPHSGCVCLGLACGDVRLPVEPHRLLTQVREQNTVYKSFSP